MKQNHFYIGFCCLLLFGVVPKVEADTIPGLGILSGTVEAPQPFVAAQVYARHQDRNVLYMVYTAGGRYRAVNMLPGSYEVSVVKEGFAVDPKRVNIKADSSSTANFVMQESEAEVTYVGSRTFEDDIQLAAYDEIYPPSPSRDMVEKYCMVCHGVNFLPGRPQTAEGWDANIDFMLNTDEAYGQEGADSLVPPDAFTTAEREMLVAYLAENFGPDSSPRIVRAETETPLDEAALAKAMYIEYQFANTDEMPGRWTQEPHFDKQGNVWVTERGYPSSITRLDPRTGNYEDFMNPDPSWTPHGLVVDDEGSVWWSGRTVHLARLNPDTGGVVNYPQGDLSGSGHTPVLDSKGNVWFSLLFGNRIGKWDRATDKIDLWEIPTPRGRPYGIFVSPDDKVWFAEFHGCKVGRFDPITETFDEYSALTQPCTVRRLGMDSKGIVWFGVFSAGKLGRIDPRTREVTEYDIPTTISEPYDTWPDSDDNIWISDGGQGGALIKFDQKTEAFTFYPSPQRTDMPKLAITGDGAIWYTPRSAAVAGAVEAGAGVLYPDVSKMKSLAAYY